MQERKRRKTDHLSQETATSIKVRRPVMKSKLHKIAACYAKTEKIGSLATYLKKRTERAKTIMRNKDIMMREKEVTLD